MRIREQDVAGAGQNKEQTNEGAASAGMGAPAAGQQAQVTLPALPPIPSLSQLPPVTIEPKRLLWLGGLAALGVVGVLEWPVVAVVGVGSYVAERFAREHNSKPGNR